MNKRASTFGVWIEVILFSLLFVIALGLIGTNMNAQYGDSKDLSFGLATNNTLQDLKETQASLDASTKEGQSSFSSLGIFTITTLPKMIMTTLGMTLRFISGGWIKGIVNLMNLGEYTSIVITIFTILYFLIVIFIIIKLLTRVNP